MCTCGMINATDPSHPTFKHRGLRRGKPRKGFDGVREQARKTAVHDLQEVYPPQWSSKFVH